MHDGVPACTGHRGPPVPGRRQLQAQVGGAADPAVTDRLGRGGGVHQAAPAPHLVLRRVPRRPVDPGLRAGVREELVRPAREQEAVAERAPPVQVDRDVRAEAGAGRVVVQPCRGHDGIDDAAVLQESGGRPRRREQQRPAGQQPPEPAQRRNPRERVPEAERPQHGDGPRVGVSSWRSHGQELSVETATTSSRSSQRAGWPSAKRIASATCAGSLRTASGPGLYCSGGPSKKCVVMPPGISSVTPTSPAVSAASARVKPTTPNFDAQYAVASETALMPSVEATVTTRPWFALRWGSAARTTAAVPSRFTTTTRVHVSSGTSSSLPQASVPAAVTTAVGGPYCCTARSTAATAAAGSARSTWTYSPAVPSADSGGCRSRTTAVPPRLATAATTAAPRPLEPPVTSTGPSRGVPSTARTRPGLTVMTLSLCWCGRCWSGRCWCGRC